MQSKSSTGEYTPVTHILLFLAPNIYYLSLQSIPVHIVRRDLQHKQNFLQIIVPSGWFERWELIWNEKRPFQCHLGDGWYQYCKSNRHLKAGRRVSFKKYERFNAEDTYELFLSPRL